MVVINYNSGSGRLIQGAQSQYLKNILDKYFGSSLGLLPDYSIGEVSKDDLVLENSEACLQLGERTN